MEIRIPKKTLADGLGMIERIIPTRHSNTILTYLPIRADERGLVLQATNGEVDLEVRLPAEINGEGHTLVPAQTFGQIVRSLPGELVELQLGTQLELSSGAFRTQLSTSTTEGYPKLEFLTSTDRIPASRLAQAITRVRYAASTEEYRAIFRGVQLEMSSQGLRAVASDGYRLARYDLPIAMPLDKKLVIPARSADELVRVFKELDTEVSLAIQDGALHLVGSSVKLSLKLMEGEFPDYTRVIPQNFVLEVNLPATELRESIKRVSVLADKHNHRVDLLFNEGRLEIAAESDFGQGREELHVEMEGERQLVVAYNSTYLIDALASVEGTVRLRLSGPSSPSVVQSAEDAGYLAVIVPLRV